MPLSCELRKLLLEMMLCLGYLSHKINVLEIQRAVCSRKRNKYDLVHNPMWWSISVPIPRINMWKAILASG